MSQRKRGPTTPYLVGQAITRQQKTESRELLRHEMLQLEEKKAHLRREWFATTDPREQQRILDAVATIKGRVGTIRLAIRKLNQPAPKTHPNDRPEGGVSHYRGAKFGAVTYGKPLRG